MFQRGFWFSIRWLIHLPYFYSYILLSSLSNEWYAQIGALPGFGLDDSLMDSTGFESDFFALFAGFRGGGIHLGSNLIREMRLRKGRFAWEPFTTKKNNNGCLKQALAGSQIAIVNTMHILK